MEVKSVVRTLTTGGYAAKTWTVISTLTKEKSQEHFNCSSLEGMPLRDEYDGVSRLHSHWGRWHARDKLIGPTVATGADFYTALTMAAFEDMGFYKANFSMAEPMRWGKDVGCEFVDEKQCRPDDHTKFPAMFCQKNYSDTMSYCTSDRVALGQCSSSWNDECLFIRSSPFGSCRNEENTALHGSRLDAGSWCLDGESLKVNVETYGPEPRVVVLWPPYARRWHVPGVRSGSVTSATVTGTTALRAALSHLRARPLTLRAARSGAPSATRCAPSLPPAGVVSRATPATMTSWALGTITPRMHCTVSPDVSKDFVNAGAPSCSAPKELSRRRSGKEKDQRGWREKSER
ncbi:surface protease GP63 [Trypanosoma rangeli]|uniref:Leishmanolysin-like peptidase n=1 Tax=Trypanosoma rangeli TaxID=5698 RepID=A0A3R7JS09_TRYRA|nr:surface protease GP63 [Trypanosoma rangeli]RNE95958.1 surface protease GP63 [Trypanosoma rangeli]|eukprot:RNE95958.1 surface protease GP63 [Trypanosoma rangeli]